MNDAGVLSGAFRARLRAIAAARARGEEVGPAAVRGAAPVTPDGVWPATWVEGYWECRPPWPACYPEAASVPEKNVVVLDLESMGRSPQPLFLVGMAVMGEGKITLRQLLAAHPEQELAVLREARRTLAEADRLVSYNGLTFDLPLLRDRWAYWREPPPVWPHHVDLLPVMRRRFRDDLGMSSCRLAEAERYILGIARPQDVASAEVPALYERAVLAGDARPLLPLLRHNVYDLAATTLIYFRVAADFPAELLPPPDGPKGEQLF